MRPHNLTLVMLGAGLLWFGWFGFNAGSALTAGNSASVVWVNTLVATGAAALAWLLTERIRDGHATSLGAASGVVAGLVAITPSCSSVSPVGAILVGAIAGALCALAVGLKYKLNIDDSLDVVGVHLVGGLWGTIAVGFFATAAAPAGVDGLFYGGGVDQLWRQVVGALAVLVFSFVPHLVIGLVLEKTIGFRVAEDVELEGVDSVEHAETAYDLGNLAGSAALQRARVGPGPRTTGPTAPPTRRSTREARDRDHQAPHARRGEERPGVVRRRGHDRQRGQRLRPPARPHRGLPRRRVHRRPGAEGAPRGPRRPTTTRPTSSTSSSRAPGPAASATARSGPCRSTTSSASAPGSAAPTRSEGR